MAKTVVVLGGGIGGLSAAHELASRGYSVRVFEAMDIPGGKARSVRLAGTGTDGRPDLPGEHGFRFFPGFYKHITDSMRRIPYAGNVDGVYDNLVQATQFQVARMNQTDPVLVARFPQSLAEFKEAIVALATANFGIPELEAVFFATRLVALLSSCDERRLGQWEKMSWWDFIAAEKMSKEYRLYLARGLTRSLVAMRAETGSTRTVGYILLQLLQDLLRPGETLDRLLNGPTNDVFIDPWVQHIQQLGVDYQLQRPLAAIHMSGGKVGSVDVARTDGTVENVTADHYVFAIPVDRFVHFLTPDVLAAAPSLANLTRLQTEWMNGIQFYLRDDVPLAHGHSIYVESPWALTSISQQQFWTERLSGVGDGTVRGILSVDISDWTSPGFLLQKPADDIDDREQIMEEVWEQLRRSLNDDPGVDLLKSNLAHWYLDDSIVTGEPTGKPENREPLLVNTINSWTDRPEAHTAISNMFLASDYVQTYTDLATMEGANEAARRAVNAILDADHDPAQRCELWPLEEPLVFEPLKLLDKIRWRLGLPPLAAPDLFPLTPASETRMTSLLQLDSTPREGLVWGQRDVDQTEVEAFADALPLRDADRRAIVSTLLHFPAACQVRGMFFDGLVNVIKRERDAETAERLMLHAGVRGRAIPFGLLPHRDFYKLYFMAAPVLYPQQPLEHGMQRIAETFYPVFRDSMVGRTLSAMMGSDPRRILDRLVDAYKMSVQDNEHSVRVAGERGMLWECRVEPSPFYAETFRGIALGTLESHGVKGGRVETVSRVADGQEHNRWVFRITW